MIRKIENRLVEIIACLRTEENDRERSMNKIKTKSFKTLPLNSFILENLETLGFHSMTPIQAEALPIILNGHDLIAQAKTGSGKTAAFGLGILAKLNLQHKKVQALVLCPTRELAEQVATEIRSLARLIKNCKVLVICGGTSEYQQLNSLEHGVHIVVGTPGRVLKFLKKGPLSLEDIGIFVLDEADRMLDMGFKEEMNAIASYTPQIKQSLLFSATFPEEIERLSEMFQINPKRVVVDSKHQQDIIKQVFIEVPKQSQKSTALMRVLGQYKPASTLIFCKTKESCTLMTKFLNEQNIAALAFHGDLEQNERTVVLTKFSNRSCLILVATDIAARGLDVKDLQAVINFDLPSDREVYTHRIGRTARAQKSGIAFSFFTADEIEKLKEIEVDQGTENERMLFNDMSTTERFNLLAPMKTMYINAGKKDKIRPSDILGALVGEAGIEAEHVGIITILNNQSYVGIAAEYCDQAISKLTNGKIKGRKLRVGLA